MIVRLFKTFGMPIVGATSIIHVHIYKSGAARALLSCPLESRVSLVFRIYRSHKCLLDMAYFFASAIDVDVKLEGEELRKQVEVKSEKDKNMTCPVYYDGDSVTGQVRFHLKIYSTCICSK